jgi:hypothetical protein
MVRALVINRDVMVINIPHKAELIDIMSLVLN